MTFFVLGEVGGGGLTLLGWSKCSQQDIKILTEIYTKPDKLKCFCHCLSKSVLFIANNRGNPHKPKKSLNDIAISEWYSYFRNILTIPTCTFGGCFLTVKLYLLFFIYIISRVSGLFKSHSQGWFGCCKQWCTCQNRGNPCQATACHIVTIQPLFINGVK